MDGPSHTFLFADLVGMIRCSRAQDAILLGLRLVDDFARESDFRSARTSRHRVRSRPSGPDVRVRWQRVRKD
jgi:hypothetical protein